MMTTAPVGLSKLLLRELLRFGMEFIDLLSGASPTTDASRCSRTIFHREESTFIDCFRAFWLLFVVLSFRSSLKHTCVDI